MDSFIVGSDAECLRLCKISLWSGYVMCDVLLASLISKVNFAGVHWKVGFLPDFS
jgi:hypothetical protein